MPVYIEKINGDANQPTDQPTNRANIEQSAFSKVRQKKKGRDLQYEVLVIEFFCGRIPLRP